MWNKILGVFLILLVLAAIVSMVFWYQANQQSKISYPPIKHINQQTSNPQCGGIAGIMCPPGQMCAYDGDYPDAGGNCVDIKP